MRRDVPECRLRDDEGGMTTLGFLLRLALLVVSLGLSGYLLTAGSRDEK